MHYLDDSYFTDKKNYFSKNDIALSFLILLFMLSYYLLITMK